MGRTLWSYTGAIPPDDASRETYDGDGMATSESCTERKVAPWNPLNHRTQTMAAETLEGTSDRLGAAGGRVSKSRLAQNGRVGDTPDTWRPGLTEAGRLRGDAARGRGH